MSSLSFDLKLDEVSASLARLSAQKLRDQMLMGMARVLVSRAQGALDKSPTRTMRAMGRKDPRPKHPLLIKSGDLRQGLHFTQLGKDSVRFGSPTKYAATHQLGRGAISPRPFFPVIEDQLTGNARTEIQDVVDALIGKASG